MIIGVDPAASKPNAIAVYEDGLLIQVYKSSDLIEIYITIEQCDHVYIEDQFLSRNPNTLKKLAQAAGELIGICKLVKVPYTLIAPIVWQTYFNLPRKPRKTKGNPIVPTRYQWGKMHSKHIIDKARELTPYNGQDDDVASSILIGWFGMTKGENHEEI